MFASLARRLSRFSRLPPHDKKLLVQAIVALPTSWVALRTIGLARVRTATSSLRTSAHAGTTSIASIAELVQFAARLVPFFSSCLTRSLVLERFLRRRGIDAQLRIGVRRNGADIEAHAWVEYEGIPINDGPDVAQQFAPFDELAPVPAFRS